MPKQLAKRVESVPLGRRKWKWRVNELSFPQQALQNYLILFKLCEGKC